MVIFHHKDLELLFALVAVLNIITGLILYQKQCCDLESWTRRKAILTCTATAIVSGGILLFLYGVDYMAQ